jgi:hypothetical protein
MRPLLGADRETSFKIMGIEDGLDYKTSDLLV